MVSIICISLAFLPIPLLKHGYEYILLNKPNLVEVEQFIKYFEHTWCFDGLFPPESWNHFNTTTPRTTNHVEASNRPLHNIVGTHPSIYNFIKGIKKLETEAQLHYNINRIHNNKPSHPRLKEFINKDLQLNELRTNFSIECENGVTLDGMIQFMK